MVELARELNRHSASATHEQTHLAEHPGQLVWIFMGMSVVGLMGETLQHLVAFGELESRAGFIWGPFSPIYGLAAVLLTMLLEPLQDKGVPLLLTVSAVVGGSLEYFASWAMETFWGVVAWSYLNIPLNFDGRTDVFHCLIWGTIGVLWVKVVHLHGARHCHDHHRFAARRCPHRWHSAAESHRTILRYRLSHRHAAEALPQHGRPRHISENIGADPVFPASYNEKKKPRLRRSELHPKMQKTPIVVQTMFCFSYRGLLQKWEAVQNSRARPCFCAP